MVDIEDDTVTDVASDAVTHDAGRHQVELVDLFANHQGMTGIMAALEAYNALGVVSQPVDNLALALITPLGAYDYNVLSHFSDQSL
jgi:hypothetical protein